MDWGTTEDENPERRLESRRLEFVHLWGRPLACGGLPGRPAPENLEMLAARSKCDPEKAPAPASRRPRPGLRHDGPVARSSPVWPYLPPTAGHCSTGSCFDGIRRRNWTLPVALGGDHARSRPSPPHPSCGRIEASRLAQNGHRQTSQPAAETHPWSSAGRPARPPQAEGLPHRESQ